MHAISQTIKNMIDNTPGYSLDTLLSDLGADKQEDEFLTPKEICNILKIKKWTFHALKRKGLFKQYRIGGGNPKYKKSEVLSKIISK